MLKYILHKYQYMREQVEGSQNIMNIRDVNDEGLTFRAKL